MSIQGTLNTTIYSAIGGTVTSAGTAVYYLQAPDNRALPYIIFDYVNEGDTNITAHRSKDIVVSIRAYATTPVSAGAIDAQVDSALHLKTLTVSGWTNYWTARENGYSLVESGDAGVKTYMSGADYRIRATK